MIIRKDIEERLEYCPLNMEEISNRVTSFYNLINSTSKSIPKKIIRLQNCLLHFRLCKAILMSLLKPEMNKYIDEEKLSQVEENIGRIDLDLSNLQDEVIKRYKGVTSTEIKNPLTFDLNIITFRNALIESMEVLVINPIMNATMKYIESDGEKTEEGELIKKDEYLWNYYLYQEIIPASYSLGEITKQKVLSFPKNISFQNQNPIGRFPTKESHEEKESKEEDIEDKYDLSFLEENEE